MDVPTWKRALKRAGDILFSIVALLAFGLILPIVAIAIRLDSRGPVFYHQVRLGIDRRRCDRRNAFARLDIDRRDPTGSTDRRKVVVEGKPFRIHKLRTMHLDSESDGVRWATLDDPRVTRVGRFLRATRLDEVPQFWNVLKGEMSVVGPRPERPPFITVLRDEIPQYLDRLRFKPGITGLAQVESGYDDSLDSVERKLALDLEYICRFSLLRDLRILVRTVWVVLSGEGAC